MVNHQIKLEKYGIRNLPLSWLSSFLKDRVSYVGLGEHGSLYSTLNIGVPQGSILGPILFLIYINDFPNSCPNLQTSLFADDTNISFSHCNYVSLVDKINIGLESITDWTLANRLTINVSKTEAMLFSNRNYESNNAFVSLNSIPIVPSSSCKFLGIIIDNKLTFSGHIDCILGRIVRNSKIFFSIKSYLPLRSRLNFYNSLIYPHLSYCIIIWGSTWEVHLKPLIIQQKRFIRMVNDSGPFEHSSPIFFKLRILKLLDIYKFFVLVHMFKSFNGNFY